PTRADRPGRQFQTRLECCKLCCPDRVDRGTTTSVERRRAARNQLGILARSAGPLSSPRGSHAQLDEPAIRQLVLRRCHATAGRRQTCFVFEIPCARLTANARRDRRTDREYPLASLSAFRPRSTRVFLQSECLDQSTPSPALRFRPPEEPFDRLYRWRSTVAVPALLLPPAP